MRALWMGVGACAFGAVSPCMCYLPWVIAGPMAWYGTWLVIQARKTATSAQSVQLANLALISNGIAALLGTMFIGVLALYFLYFFVVFVALAIGGMGSGNF